MLGRATAKHGRIRFSAAPGPGGERKIQALLTLAGIPHPAIVVGSYTAPAPAQPQAAPPASGAAREPAADHMGRASNATHYVAVVLSDRQLVL